MVECTRVNLANFSRTEEAQTRRVNKFRELPWWQRLLWISGSNKDATLKSWWDDEVGGTVSVTLLRGRAKLEQHFAFNPNGVLRHVSTTHLYLQNGGYYQARVNTLELNPDTGQLEVSDRTKKPLDRNWINEFGSLPITPGKR